MHTSIIHNVILELFFLGITFPWKEWPNLKRSYYQTEIVASLLKASIFKWAFGNTEKKGSFEDFLGWKWHFPNKPHHTNSWILLKHFWSDLFLLIYWNQVFIRIYLESWGFSPDCSSWGDLRCKRLLRSASPVIREWGMRMEQVENLAILFRLLLIVCVLCLSWEVEVE